MSYDFGFNSYHGIEDENDYDNEIMNRHNVANINTNECNSSYNCNNVRSSYNNYNENAYSGYNGNQFSMNFGQLLSLGFSSEEVQMLTYIMNNRCKVTVPALSQAGIPYEEAKRLRYMYDVISGKVNIVNTRDLCNHLRKLFGQHRRISLQDLATSTIATLPRKCVIAGIPENLEYAVYNSNRYKGEAMKYKVISVSGSRIIVSTMRKPRIKYGAGKKLYMIIDNENRTIRFIDDERLLQKSEINRDGIEKRVGIEICNMDKNGLCTVAVDKKLARMCNRYVVVASLKRPEFYLYMYEIVAIEGTKVYVYAKTSNSGEDAKYNGGTMRIYDYGFDKNQIRLKTLNVATRVYGKVSGVYAEEVGGNCDFVMLEQPKKKRIIVKEEDVDDNDWA